MRAGYEHRLADDLIDGFTGATLGMGIAYRKIRLDYSYIPFGELGNSQRVSLVYMFDDQASSTPVPTPSPTAEVTAVVTPDPTPWPTATPEPIIQFQVPQSALKQAQNFEKEGRYREAVQAYNQAIQLNPQGIAAWRGLGMVYYRLGRHEFAIRCFEEVLRLNPSDTRLRDWLEKYKSSQPNSFIIRDLPFS